MIATLLAVYAAVALLAGLLLVDGTRDWRVRAAAIIVAPLLSFALWQSTQPPYGWPTPTQPPLTATFLWGDVREPDQATGDPGQIFLWLDVGADRPRAFSLPYSRQLHKRVQAAMDATRHGHTITVARPRGSQRGGAMRFYPHPPIRLPAKPR